MATPAPEKPPAGDTDGQTTEEAVQAAAPRRFDPFSSTPALAPNEVSKFLLGLSAPVGTRLKHHQRCVSLPPTALSNFGQLRSFAPCPDPLTKPYFASRTWALLCQGGPATGGRASTGVGAAGPSEGGRPGPTAAGDLNAARVPQAAPQEGETKEDVAQPAAPEQQPGTQQLDQQAQQQQAQPAALAPQQAPAAPRDPIKVRECWK